VQHCWGSDEHGGWRACRWKMLEGNCRLHRDDERALGKVNRGFVQQSWRQSFTVTWSTFLTAVDIGRSTARVYLHYKKPPAFITYQNEQREWFPVTFPFEKLSLPNQKRAHSLMTQHCCRELTGGLSLCSMERITYESQTTARSCTLRRKRLGGPRKMCLLGASERVEK